MERKQKTIFIGLITGLANGLFGSGGGTVVVPCMEKYLDISEIYVNGGLTNSDIFNKIQCSVYGKRIIRRGKTDATARGALMIAATILGMYTEIETAFAKIMSQNEEKIYYPEMESVLFYEQARERMNGFYTKIKE